MSRLKERGASAAARPERQSRDKEKSRNQGEPIPAAGVDAGAEDWGTRCMGNSWIKCGSCKVVGNQFSASGKSPSNTSSGHSIRVTPGWNYFDFYTTLVQIAQPDGSTTETVLDGDDSKSRSVPLALDEQNHTATVSLRGGRARIIRW